MGKAMAGISVFSFYTCFPYMAEASLFSFKVGVKAQALSLYSLTAHNSQLTSFSHFPLFTPDSYQNHFLYSLLITHYFYPERSRRASLISHFSFSSLFNELICQTV